MVLTLKKFSNIGCQAGENIPKYPILDNLHSSRHFQIHIEFPILQPFNVQKNILFNIRFINWFLNKSHACTTFIMTRLKKAFIISSSIILNVYSFILYLSCIFFVYFMLIMFNLSQKFEYCFFFFTVNDCETSKPKA